MSEMILNTEIREGSGKANAGRLRRTGRVPAIIYGEIEKPTSVSIDAHELIMYLREKHALINLSLEGKNHRVVVRDIQYHPVKGSISHIDFLEVKKGNKITMAVPITFEGSPVGVKEGGLLDKIKNDLSISVLPKDIPNEIVINVENLELGDAIRVADVKVGNFELIDDPQDVICRVAIPRVEVEVEVEEEEELEEDMAEPEVITARDKEDKEDSKE